jgi:hypothetical protein
MDTVTNALFGNNRAITSLTSAAHRAFNPISITTGGNTPTNRGGIGVSVVANSTFNNRGVTGRVATLGNSTINNSGNIGAINHIGSNGTLRINNIGHIGLINSANNNLLATNTGGTIGLVASNSGNGSLMHSVTYNDISGTSILAISSNPETAMALANSVLGSMFDGGKGTEEIHSGQSLFITGINPFTAITELNMISDRFGFETAMSVWSLSERAKAEAIAYAREHDFFIQSGSRLRPQLQLETWDNAADAYRHFIWNVYMTQQLGVDVAQFAGDVHEYLALVANGWIMTESSFHILTKINQSTLMDLQNNAVGRDLASNPHLSSLSARALFDHANANNMLILDAGRTYQFYGIREDLPIMPGWTVDVIWGLERNTAVVLDPIGGNSMIQFGMGR